MLSWRVNNMSIKKLTVSDIRRVMGVSYKQNITVQWHTERLTLRQFLPLKEYLETIDSVVNDCIDPSTGKPVYELLEFAMRANIISSYAYVDMPTEVDEFYAAVYCSDLYDTVCKYVNSSQVAAIKEAVNKRLTDGAGVHKWAS